MTAHAEDLYAECLGVDRHQGRRKVTSASLCQPAIHIYAIGDLDDQHEKVFIVDGVDNAVIPEAYTIQVIGAFQLLATGRARVAFELFDSSDDLSLDRLRKGFELAVSGWRELDRVGHGGALESEFLLDGLERLGALLLCLCQRGAGIGQVDPIL